MDLQRQQSPWVAFNRCKVKLLKWWISETRVSQIYRVWRSNHLLQIFVCAINSCVVSKWTNYKYLICSVVGQVDKILHRLWLSQHPLEDWCLPHQLIAARFCPWSMPCLKHLTIIGFLQSVLNDLQRVTRPTKEQTTTWKWRKMFVVRYPNVGHHSILEVPDLSFSGEETWAGITDVWSEWVERTLKMMFNLWIRRNPGLMITHLSMYNAHATELLLNC